jgi:hypothetical protein
MGGWYRLVVAAVGMGLLVGSRTLELGMRKMVGGYNILVEVGVGYTAAAAAAAAGVGYMTAGVGNVAVVVHNN